MGQLTYRLTRHAFAYEPLGEVVLRGRVGQRRVDRLKGPLDAPREARGLEAFGLSAPLIGRDTELARMLGGLDRACGGSVQLVRLIGEAGIGKTRLVNEFVARDRDEERFAGVAIRRAACSPRASSLRHSGGGIAQRLRDRRTIVRRRPRRSSRGRHRRARAVADERASHASARPCFGHSAVEAGRPSRARATQAPDPFRDPHNLERRLALRPSLSLSRTCTGRMRPRSTCCACSPTGSTGAG